MNAQGYVNNSLRPVAVPFLRQHVGMLMHDNARPHVAAFTRAFLAQQNVPVLPWPACSPDMNPIEHIWDLLGKNVRKNHQLNTLQDLENALQFEWNRIPHDVVRRYARSMRSRMLTVIRRRGGHNRY